MYNNLSYLTEGTSFNYALLLQDAARVSSLASKIRSSALEGELLRFSSHFAKVDYSQRINCIHLFGDDYKNRDDIDFVYTFTNKQLYELYMALCRLRWLTEEGGFWYAFVITRSLRFGPALNCSRLIALLKQFLLYINCMQVNEDVITKYAPDHRFAPEICSELQFTGYDGKSSWCGPWVDEFICELEILSRVAISLGEDGGKLE